MDINTVKPILTQFNNFIDSLIDDFKEYKLDEETIAFLVGKTRNFIEFSKITLLNVIMGLLRKINDAGYNMDDEIKVAEDMINGIFDDINDSLDKILPEDDQEQHVHDHGHHHHHHHHHIDVDAIQEDIDKIVANLKILKVLVGDIVNMIISALKYQAEEISEVVFKKEYDSFKDNLKNFKEELEKEEQ